MDTGMDDGQIAAEAKQAAAEAFPESEFTQPAVLLAFRSAFERGYLAAKRTS